ncbi:hypothetical protein [Dysgonomonas termitidis]|uniref:Uncharacterized protein n=1 Tax=Dysgonomonas termitidis TaxID=1516126 RepID=A0ABV9L179_9BACT
MNLPELDKLFEKYGDNDEYTRMTTEQDAITFIQKYERWPDASNHIKYLCGIILAISDKYLEARKESILRNTIR